MANDQREIRRKLRILEHAEATGKQAVNVYLGGDYYVAHRGTDPVYDIKLNVTFLFPE